MAVCPSLTPKQKDMVTFFHKYPLVNYRKHQEIKEPNVKLVENSFFLQRSWLKIFPSIFKDDKNTWIGVPLVARW